MDEIKIYPYDSESPLRHCSPTPLITYPLLGTDSTCKGWYQYVDERLSPQIIYGSWPPSTTLKLGGRLLIIDRPVSVKIESKKNLSKSYNHWTHQKQHSARIKLSLYHRDFENIEVAYSHSYPQTHIWICGYLVHLDEQEVVLFSTYNAAVKILPKNRAQSDDIPARHTARMSFKDYKSSMLEMNYSSVIHSWSNGLSIDGTNCNVASEEFNSCGTPIHIREQYSVEAMLPNQSSPYEITQVRQKNNTYKNHPMHSIIIQ